MKHAFVLALLVSAFGPAFAAKACVALKAEIAAKLDAAGVKNYVLAVVPNDQVNDAKVVGSCDGGARKITYARK